MAAFRLLNDRTRNRRSYAYLPYAALTGVVVLAVIAPTIYLRVRRDAVDSRVEGQHLLLNVTQDTLTFALEQIDTAATQLVLDGALTTIPDYFADRELLLIRAVRERLIGFLNLHPTVAHLGLVYPNEELVYDPRMGLYDLDDYEYRSLLSDIENRRDPSRRLEVSTVTGDQSNASTGIAPRVSLTFVKSIPLMHFSPRAYLILIVSNDLIRDSVERIEGSADRQIALLADHRLLTSVRLAPPPSAVELLSREAARGVTDVEGTRYIVATTTPDSLGLSLLSLVPVDTALAGLRGLNLFMVAVVAVAVVALVGAGLWAADQLGQPLATIARLVDGGASRRNGRTRIDVAKLRQDIGTIMVRSRRLQDEVNLYAPIVADRKLRLAITRGGRYALDIGLGEIGGRSVRASVVVFVRTQRLSPDHLVVEGEPTARDSVDTPASTTSYDQIEPVVVVREIIRSSTEAFVAEATDFADSNILVLCRHTADLPMNRVRSFALRLLRGMEAIHLAASVGIGSPVPNVDAAPRSFAEATRLADLAAIRGEEAVLAPDDMTDSTHHCYPFDEEAEVIEAIRRADPPSATRATERFIGRLTPPSPIAQRTGLLRLLASVDSAIHNMGESLESVQGGDDPFVTVIEAQTIAEALSHLSCLYAAVVDRLTAGRDRRLDDLVEKIRRVIHERMGDDLSLHAIAEEVYLSESYMSRLFREATGEQLRGYIARVRMERAAQLLVETRISITEVGRKVGYERLQSFAKTFKREIGVTPSEYRRTRAVRVN